jgi:membrane-bound metal-dependent hydrolase YbcI (DUF457 family)
MDIFSHGLYGAAAFGRKSKKDFVTAFLFGIGPDLLAFGPFFLFIFLGLEVLPAGNFEPPNAKILPDYVHFLYGITHSLFLYGLFFALLWSLGKKTFAKLTLGWPLHILVDIPTHANGFFPTPFLWPLSDFSVSGIPWSSPEIFIPNIIVLAVIYLYWGYKKRKKSVV